MSNRRNKFSTEVRARAARMVGARQRLGHSQTRCVLQ